MLINNYFFDIFRRLLKNIHTYHKKYTAFSTEKNLAPHAFYHAELARKRVDFFGRRAHHHADDRRSAVFERYAQPAHDIFPVFVEKFVHPVRFIEIFHDDGYYADLFFHAKLLPRIRRATPFTKSIITYNFV